jgi:hypothetical protein
MSEVLDKIKEVITSSNLSPDDQNDLLIFLPILPREALEDLLVLFKENPKLIKSFNEDFKARLDILIDGKNKWDKLIAQEEEILNEEDSY